MPYNQTNAPRSIKPETVTFPTTTSQKAKQPTASRSITRRITSARVRTRTATKRLIAASSALALILILASAARAQSSSESTKSIAMGQQQLVAARTTSTEEAYRLAETTLDQVVQTDPKNPVARVYLGLARMELSGWIARQGRFGPSGELMNKAIVDLDAAVALAPDNLQVRILRGSSYAEFPSFLNKGSLAREDLEAVVHHPNFASQSSETRARVDFTLGRVYAAGGESEKARASWTASVAADRRLAKASSHSVSWRNWARLLLPKMLRDAGCLIAFPTFL